MSPTLNLILTIIFYTVLVIVIGYSLLPFFRSYRLSDKGIEILAFNRFVQRRINFDNIAHIEVLSTSDAWFPFDSRSIYAYKGINRMRGNFLLLRLKRGWLYRFVLISPDDAEDFVRHVQQRVGSTTDS